MRPERELIEMVYACVHPGEEEKYAPLCDAIKELYAELAALKSRPASDGALREALEEWLGDVQGDCPVRRCNGTGWLVSSDSSETGLGPCPNPLHKLQRELDALAATPAPAKVEVDLEKVREALEYYAAPETWKLVQVGDNEFEAAIDDVQGLKAQEALSLLTTQPAQGQDDEVKP